MQFRFYVILLSITTSSKPEEFKSTDIEEQDSIIIPAVEEEQEDETVVATQRISDEGSAANYSFFADNSTTKLSEVKNNSSSQSISNHTAQADLQQPQLPENVNDVQEVPPFEPAGINYQPTFPFKNSPWKLLQYLHPANIVGSLSHNINKLSGLLTYPYNPNDGVINFLNPSYLWQKISDKGQQLLSNSNSAIFGFGQPAGHDYPFPYRASLYNNTN